VDDRRKYRGHKRAGRKRYPCRTRRLSMARDLGGLVIQDIDEVDDQLGAVSAEVT
jgi:hypothetical protein